ncbi:MAG TPA: hypothetical protein PKV31_01055, partial [Saprospiraceae bacterium]|nr:hypothetical protein [Saprospiraceae bacterium]
NWRSVASECRKLVQKNASTLTTITGHLPIAPINDDFTAQMYAAQIDTTDSQALHDRLYRTFNIQIPVMAQGDQFYIRYSINGFNEQADLDKLFDALRILL